MIRHYAHLCLRCTTPTSGIKLCKSWIIVQNSTFISLIPKSADVTEFGDYRPIALCNLIYKFITKIIANWLKVVMNSLVSLNQTAFIEGWSIVDNILLCHEVVRGFDRVNHTPVALLKIDLRKAYDSVSRRFVEEVLFKMGFPNLFRNWVMECISTPRYSILINGSPAGYFEGTKGLRQGNPVSPYIFCLVMEVLSCMIEKEVAAGRVKLVPKCNATKLSHLAFADDLMIFTRADAASLTAVNNVLNQFILMSGLEVNRSKSTQIFAGTPIQMQTSLKMITNFREGKLPIRYLGVPLISSKLSKNDCTPILDRIQKRLTGWKTRPLSYASRLTLIRSIL